MALDNTALEAIEREVKAFGDDARKMHESLNKDITDVRKIAEDAAKEAKNAVDDAVFKERVEKFTASIAEKQKAMEDHGAKLEAEHKKRLDAIETMARRSFTSMPEGDGDEAKRAIEFFTTKAAIGGNLKLGNRPTAETVSIDEYKAWADNYEIYLRRDDRAVETKALSVGSDPDGGYLVPTAQSSRIISRIFESSPMRQFATVETIGSSALEIPIDDDEFGAEWVGETENRSDTSTAQLGLQRILVHELAARPKATQQMLEDASIDVESWLSGKMADRFARREAAAFIAGTGVKQPRGILTYPAASGTGEVARNTVRQINSGDAATITADAIVKLPFTIKSAYLANAAWMMKRSTIQSVMLLKDGQGQYLWRPGLEAGRPSTLAGYSVAQADDMPVIAGGALAIAFGDFRAAYTIVDRLGISTLRDPFTVKPFVEFYTRKRVGGDVVNFEAFALMKIAA